MARNQAVRLARLHSGLVSDPHHIPFGLQHVGGNASCCPQVAAVLHCGESQKGPCCLGPSPRAGIDARVGAIWLHLFSAGAYMQRLDRKDELGPLCCRTLCLQCWETKQSATETMVPKFPVVHLNTRAIERQEKLIFLTAHFTPSLILFFFSYRPNGLIYLNHESPVHWITKLRPFYFQF